MSANFMFDKFQSHMHNSSDTHFKPEIFMMFV